MKAYRYEVVDAWGVIAEQVERWVSPECDEAIHDEAIGMLP